MGNCYLHKLCLKGWKLTKKQCKNDIMCAYKFPLVTTLQRVANECPNLLTFYIKKKRVPNHAPQGDQKLNVQNNYKI
jgi:hypothetical protein